MKPMIGWAATLAGWLALGLSLGSVAGCGGDGGAQGGDGGAGAGAQGGEGAGTACEIDGGGAGNPAPSACKQPFLSFADVSDGDHLLSLSLPQAPQSPIVFLANVWTPGGSCPTEIGMDVTPLDKKDRKTPVGPEQALGLVSLGSQGGFVFEVAQLDVPKEANTIVSITMQMAVTLAGHACGDGSFLCGTMSGQVITPKVSVNDSTFALQRITDPEAYPAPVINCALAPADPL